MGFFGTYLFSGQGWTEFQPDKEPDVPEPWLLLDIHDSDIATVLYRPSGLGSGVAYLGFTPRVYFEDETASESTEPQREANGLAEWWTRVQDTHADAAELDAKAADLLAYLAEDTAADLEDSDDDVEMDDADIFVEIKAARFLSTLGLPVPDDLKRAE